MYLPSLNDVQKICFGLALATETKFVIEFVVAFTVSNTIPDVSSDAASEADDSSDKLFNSLGVPSSEMLMILGLIVVANESNALGTTASAVVWEVLAVVAATAVAAVTIPAAVTVTVAAVTRFTFIGVYSSNAARVTSSMWVYLSVA